ncbi:MAG: hypothetical protein IT306_17960 [Chloroflexi bacterium]|nr:hypothetical protein [Chloroflexota bacterium]
MTMPGAPDPLYAIARRVLLEALAGPGSRSAHLEPHGNRSARRAKGLEAALADHQEMVLAALDPADKRQLSVNVAGPAALLVAKLHKLAERLDDARQQRPKDALDIYRLLTAVSTHDLATALRRLREPELSASSTAEAMAYLELLFSTASSRGSSLAASIIGPGDDPETVAASCAALTQDLLAALNAQDS